MTARFRFNKLPFFFASKKFQFSFRKISIKNSVFEAMEMEGKAKAMAMVTAPVPVLSTAAVTSVTILSDF